VSTMKNIMKRSLVALLSLAVIALGTLAQATTPQEYATLLLTGAGKAGGGGGGTPTLTFIGATAAAFSGSVATVTNANIGTAAADRLVVVVFTDGATETAPTVTIGGVTATVHAFASGANESTTGIASLLVTAGTTATIVVTYATGTVSDGANFKVYTITGLSSTTPVGTGTNWTSTTNPISTTVATSSGGVVIAGAVMFATVTTVSFSGTETYTMDHTGSQNAFMTEGSGRATGTASSGSSTVTATWAAGSSHTSIAAVSWR
jgi:hypothetical protein